ncbi:hypothetical protein DFJ73DRAFT_822904 [Zopfochytrium polystomum]|nr:hypothetical protein DFJ73DRAFT_822904 [Zopfochytrium polystomum]
MTLDDGDVNEDRQPVAAVISTASTRRTAMTVDQWRIQVTPLTVIKAHWLHAWFPKHIGRAKQYLSSEEHGRILARSTWSFIIAQMAKRFRTLSCLAQPWTIDAIAVTLKQHVLNFSFLPFILRVPRVTAVDVSGSSPSHYHILPSHQFCQNKRLTSLLTSRTRPTDSFCRCRMVSTPSLTFHFLCSTGRTFYYQLEVQRSLSTRSIAGRSTAVESSSELSHFRRVLEQGSPPERAWELYLLFRSENGFLTKLNSTDFDLLIRLPPHITERLLLVVSDMTQLDIKPTALAYNLIMRTLIQDGHAIKARKVFSDMLVAGVDPDVESFTIMLSAASALVDEDGAERCLNEMAAMGLEPNVEAMFLMAKFNYSIGKVSSAEGWVEAMIFRLVNAKELGSAGSQTDDSHAVAQAIHSLIRLRIKEKQVDQAIFLIGRLTNLSLSGRIPSSPRNLTSNFAAAVEAYAMTGDMRSAVDLSRAMEAGGFNLNAATFASLAAGFARRGDVFGAEAQLRRALHRGVVPAVAGFNAVMRAEAEAAASFHAVDQKAQPEEQEISQTENSFSLNIKPQPWRTRFDRWCRRLEQVGVKPNSETFEWAFKQARGDIVAVEELVSEITAKGVQITKNLFRSIIDACSGNLQVMLQYFKKMDDFGIKPVAPVYSAVLREAYAKRDWDAANDIIDTIGELHLRNSAVLNARNQCLNGMLQDAVESSQWTAVRQIITRIGKLSPSLHRKIVRDDYLIPRFIHSSLLAEAVQSNPDVADLHYQTLLTKKIPPTPHSLQVYLQSLLGAGRIVQAMNCLREMAQDVSLPVSTSEYGSKLFGGVLNLLLFSVLRGNVDEGEPVLVKHLSSRVPAIMVPTKSDKEQLEQLLSSILLFRFVPMNHLTFALLETLLAMDPLNTYEPSFGKAEQLLKLVMSEAGCRRFRDGHPTILDILKLYLRASLRHQAPLAVADTALKLALGAGVQLDEECYRLLLTTAAFEVDAGRAITCAESWFEKFVEKFPFVPPQETTCAALMRVYFCANEVDKATRFFRSMIYGKDESGRWPHLPPPGNAVLSVILRNKTKLRVCEDASILSEIDAISSGALYPSSQHTVDSSSFAPLMPRTGRTRDCHAMIELLDSFLASGHELDDSTGHEIIRALVRCKRFDRMNAVIWRMVSNGVQANVITERSWVMATMTMRRQTAPAGQAQCTSGILRFVDQLLAAAKSISGQETDAALLTALVRGAATAGDTVAMEYGLHLLQKAEQNQRLKDDVLELLIWGYAEAGDTQKMESVTADLEKSALPHAVRTRVNRHHLVGYLRAGNISSFKSTLVRMNDSRLPIAAKTLSRVVLLLCQIGHSETAWELIVKASSSPKAGEGNRQKPVDVVVLNCFMSGCLDNKQVDSFHIALKFLLDSDLLPDGATWVLVMRWMADSGQPTAAMRVWDFLWKDAPLDESVQNLIGLDQSDGKQTPISATRVTKNLPVYLTMALDICGHSGQTDLARSIWADVKSTGYPYNVDHLRSYWRALDGEGSWSKHLEHDGGYQS